MLFFRFTQSFLKHHHLDLIVMRFSLCLKNFSNFMEMDLDFQKLQMVDLNNSHTIVVE
jgi:hypothetical protein